MQQYSQKIAFFGTPDFTTGFLDVLAQAGYTPALIVTNPDRPVGRGMHMHAPAPKTWAEQRGIGVAQPEKITPEFIEELKKQNFDLFIVVAYGKILPEALIQLPVFGTINVHYSLLPKYRGATPVEAAILHGDIMTGVCIQQMVYELDAGDIIAQKEIGISPTDTTTTLREKLNIEALTLLPQTLAAIFAGTIQLVPQDSTLATKTKKIHKEDGLVTLADDPTVLDRKYRAYSPHPGIYFMQEKSGILRRVKITKARFENDNFTLERVIPENQKEVRFEEFLRQ